MLYNMSASHNPMVFLGHTLLIDLTDVKVVGDRPHVDHSG